MTELCEIAFKHKTDKCPKIRHTYTPLYFEMFKDIRNDVKKVFEMGIGYPKVMGHVTKVTGDEYKTGASLFMWREFFPNAFVYGADHAPSSMVEGEKKIKTFLCDEHKEADIKKLIDEVGSDIDIFVDDGAHDHISQLFLAKTVLPLLKKDVIYIIEDVFIPKRITGELESLGYKCEVPELPLKRYREHLVIVKNK